MAEPIVGVIKSIGEPTAGGGPGVITAPAGGAAPDTGARSIEITGADDQSVTLTFKPDAAQSNADFCILDLLHRTKKPAFVDATDDHVITRALAPKVTTVTSIEPDGDGWLHVRLAASATRHRLPSSDKTWHDALDNARKHNLTVRVTTDPETATIINVSPDTAIKSGPAPRPKTEVQIIAGVSTMTHEQARTFIDTHYEPNVCKLPKVNGGCMPFQYPDDFCFAVAHRMTEWLLAQGVVAGKVWLFGKLHVDTENRESCRQDWDFHVAAFVRDADRPAGLLVFDPVVSMTDPIPVGEWQKKVHGNDGAATRQITEADVYRKGEGDAGMFLDSPQQVEDDLTLMRCALRRRANGHKSPPPYARCKTAGHH